MLPLLTSEMTRFADHYTIAELGIHEIILMEHAALAVAESLKARFGRSLSISRGMVIAGPGNNGKDATAAARILSHWGVSLKIVQWGEPLLPSDLQACDWVIDGIFGTGLKRPVTGNALAWVQELNRVSSQKWIVSIDVPSGLNADTGYPMGDAVIASETIVLGFYKKGLVTGDAANHTGTTKLATILIPREIPGMIPTAYLLTETDAVSLPPRKPASHKGSFGHVYIWAAEPSKEGASCLASLGALRSGTGLVTVIIPSKDLTALKARLTPEVMTLLWDRKTFSELSLSSAVVLGPGMGLQETSWQWIEQALASSLPLVLDADALTLLGQHRDVARKLLQARRALTVLTPHPKEAARLLGKSVEAIQADRYQSHAELVKMFSCGVVLKGKGTIVGTADSPQIVVTQGDTALAKGGTGDLLSGVLAGFLAQGMAAPQAMAIACYCHGRASELLSQSVGQERSSLASEIAQMLPIVFKELQCLNTGSHR